MSLPSTVADIPDGAHVVASISSGQVVLDGPVAITPMLEPQGTPVYALINPVGPVHFGGTGRGPLVPLDHPARQDAAGTWHVQLS